MSSDRHDEEHAPEEHADLAVDSDNAGLRRTRAFFAERAQHWHARFPHDEPAYAAAVGELGPLSGGCALDVGCGTGRALRPLRDAVGPEGVVLGVDVTPEMLHVARDAVDDTAGLVVFHPVGRAALAQRHGRTLRPGELLDPAVLPAVLAAAGWTTERIDDAEHRYFVLARRA